MTSKRTTRTIPKQAASGTSVDRWQRELRAILRLLGMWEVHTAKERLRALLKSTARAERR